MKEVVELIAEKILAVSLIAVLAVVAFAINIVVGVLVLLFLVIPLGMYVLGGDD